MHFPLHRKIMLGFGAALVAGTLTAQLRPAEPTLRPQPTEAEMAEGAGTCVRLSRHMDQSAVLSELSRSCVIALQDIYSTPSPEVARVAFAYLDRLKNFDLALQSLSRSPNDTGAYLIARQTGALGALRSWDTARSASQSGEWHTAAR